VLRNGFPVQRWRRDRARLLLKFLVIQNKPVPRHTLQSYLWPDARSGDETTHLRVVLHALRQALGTWDGHEYVRIDDDHVSLDPNAPVWIDTQAFMSHVHAAERFIRDENIHNAIGQYISAEHIYRGDYLAEDSSEHSTLLRREELKDRYQVVLTRLADFCMESGDFVGAIERCHKLLTQDNCREDAYQRLMACHAALGQLTRARRWYQMCQMALRDQLHIEPGPATRALYERLMNGRNA
jgi:DNA-binding SARP family transcriptional activator